MQDSYAESMGFQGTGYAAFDPLTGSCGFFISGGIAGGMSLPSPLALRNGNPEYIEYPEIPRDGDPAGAIDWLEIGSFFASIVSAAMITSAGSLSFTGRCVALVSLLAPGVAFVDSLCMAIVEKKHGRSCQRFC